MISIQKATKKDYDKIVSIGRISVTEAHKDSCSAEILNEYIERNYNAEEVQNELSNLDNIYHIIKHNDNPVGFSKIVLNEKHPNITLENVAKLDRIYLLSEFHGFKLGYELLKFNIEFSKNKQQSGIWLYTWIGNKKAINFYDNVGFKIIGSHNFLVAKKHYNLNHQMFLDFSL